MILQYGNLTLLSVEELNGGMFPKAQYHDGVKIYGEDKWKLHHSDYKIFGINIEVPDIYPILKYPEAKRKSRRAGYVKVNQQTKLNVPPPVPTILQPEVPPHDTIDGSSDPMSTGYLPHIGEGGNKNDLKLSELDDMIEKLRKKRSNLNQPVGLHSGPTLTSLDKDSTDGELSSDEGEDVVTDGVVKHGMLKPSNSIRRVQSNER